LFSCQAQKPTERGASTWLHLSHRRQQRKSGRHGASNGHQSSDYLALAGPQEVQSVYVISSYRVNHNKKGTSLLAIGYARIGNTNTRIVHMHTKARIASQALYILAISNETRFEFLFTDVSGETSRRDQPIFASVFDVYQ